MNRIMKFSISLIIIFVLIFILSFTNYSYGEKVELDITSDKFVEQFNPDKYGGNELSRPVIDVMIPVINKILNIIQILGAIILVLSLALAGINGVLSAEDNLAEDLGINLGTNINEYGAKLDGVKQLNKSALSKIIRRGSLGSIVMFSSATIVKIVFRIVFSIT